MHQLNKQLKIISKHTKMVTKAESLVQSLVWIKNSQVNQEKNKVLIKILT